MNTNRNEILSRKLPGRVQGPILFTSIVVSMTGESVEFAIYRTVEGIVFTSTSHKPLESAQPTVTSTTIGQNHAADVISDIGERAETLAPNIEGNICRFVKDGLEFCLLLQSGSLDRCFSVTGLSPVSAIDFVSELGRQRDWLKMAISREDAIQIGKKTALKKGWLWLEPIRATCDGASWTIVTNYPKRGRNVRLRISAEDGAVVNATFARR